MKRILEKVKSDEDVIFVDVSKYILKLDKNFVNYLCKLIPPNSRVLDVGCGIGTILNYLQQKRADLTLKGVDNSLKVISASRMYNNEKVKIINCDAEYLQFRDKSFDFVISSSFLHHISKPIIALKEMMRITKIGGKVVVRDLIRPKTVKRLEKVVYNRKEPKIVKNILRDSLFSSFEINEVRKYLVKLGIVDYKIIKKGIRFILIINK